MSHVEEHARVGGRSGFRKIKIGGDVKDRTALADKFFEPICRAVESAGGAEFERRAFGQGAGELEERAARPSLILADGGRSFQLRDTRGSAFVCLGGQGGKIIGQTTRVLP